MRWREEGIADRTPGRLPVTSLDEVPCWATPPWADPLQTGLGLVLSYRGLGWFLFMDSIPTPRWGLVKKHMNLLLRLSAATAGGGLLASLEGAMRGAWLHAGLLRPSREPH